MNTNELVGPPKPWTDHTLADALAQQFERAFQEALCYSSLATMEFEPVFRAMRDRFALATVDALRELPAAAFANTDPRTCASQVLNQLLIR